MPERWFRASHQGTYRTRAAVVLVATVAGALLTLQVALPARDPGAQLGHRAGRPELVLLAAQVQEAFDVRA